MNVSPQNNLEKTTKSALRQGINALEHVNMRNAYVRRCLSFVVDPVLRGVLLSRKHFVKDRQMICYADTSFRRRVLPDTKDSAVPKKFRAAETGKCSTKMRPL